jgi:hypothetical protein
MLNLANNQRRYQPAVQPACSEIKRCSPEKARKIVRARKIELI